MARLFQLLNCNEFQFVISILVTQLFIASLWLLHEKTVEP